jgi:dihydrofolate reductase
MRKLIVSEGVSLDGVFDAQTMGQWAHPFFSEERDAVVRKAVLASDAVLYGRKTYDLDAYYWPNLKKDEYGIADKMNSMPKYVVTSTPLQSKWNNTTIIQGNVLEAVARLKDQPGQNIFVKGSAVLVEALIQAGLVDQIEFMVHPVIVGSGKRFFREGMGLTKLDLVERQTLSKGVLVLTYAPAR